MISRKVRDKTNVTESFTDARSGGRHFPSISSRLTCTRMVRLVLDLILQVMVESRRMAFTQLPMIPPSANDGICDYPDVLTTSDEHLTHNLFITTSRI